MLPVSLLLLLAKATIVLVAALGITHALQRAPAGARHLVWLATLGGLLLVPALAAWLPLRIIVLPAAPAAEPPRTAQTAPDMAAATPPAPAPAESREWLLTPRAESAQSGAAVQPTRSDAAAFAGRRVADVASATLALWATVALAIGASLANAWLAVRRIVRHAQTLDTPDWLTPLWEIADRFGLDEPPRLLRSDRAKMPFACGITRPTIVLPAESDGWTLDRRRAVLLHELAHVRRRDLAGHTLARLVCAVYWFHPLVWTAAKRLRAESERACDDLALACGARPADYAEHLLDIVASVRRDTTPLVALAMARRNEFEGRMLDILDSDRPRTTPSRWQAVSLVGVLALITTVVGAAAPAPATSATSATSAALASRGGLEWPRPDAVASEERVDQPTEPEPPGASHATAARVRSGVASALQAGAGDGGASPAATVSADKASNADNQVDSAADSTLELDTAEDRDTVGALALRADAAPRPTPAGVRREDERPALLAKVLRTDTSTSLRRIAAWGLAEYAEVPVASAALVAALRGDVSPAVREMAAWALAEGRGGGTTRDALGAALRGDANAKVRATAAWALGNVGDRASADALVAALSDSSAEVRTSAIWALGNVAPRPAPRALVAMLRDRSAEVRELTAWALFNIEDPETIPALQAALQAEQDTELQVAYIRALAALGEPAVGALRGLLDSPNARIKSIVVRALAGGDATGPWPWPWPEPRPSP